VASASVYKFDGREYPIEIIRKKNKNTYLRVKDNKIVITTNYFVSTRKLGELITNNKKFVESALLVCI